MTRKFCNVMSQLMRPAHRLSKLSGSRETRRQFLPLRIPRRCIPSDPLGIERPCGRLSARPQPEASGVAVQHEFLASGRDPRAAEEFQPQFFLHVIEPNTRNCKHRSAGFGSVARIALRIKPAPAS